MKLLAKVSSNSERIRLEELLNQRGIATYASSGTNQSRASAGGDFAIFVCIDAQFEDAVALLADPNHEVAQPIDVTEFNRAIEETGVGPIAKWVIFPVVIAVLALAVTLYLLRGQVA